MHRIFKYLQSGSLFLFDAMRVDVRSLAFVRIFLGVLLSITFLNFAFYTPLLMSDAGVFPREMSLEATRHREFSVFLASGSAMFQYIVLGLAGLAALLFACNVMPRVTIAVCWAIFYSVTFRSTDYNFGLCPAMLGVIFWALFVPWKRAPRWPLAQILESPDRRERVMHWSLCGMFLSCAAISYGAGVAKLRNFDAWFVNYQAMRLDISYYTNVNPVTRTLAELPYLLSIVSPLVVFVEMGAPVLLAMPLARRFFVPLALILATLVYGGIAISIHVGIFPLIPLVGFYLMIGGRFWDWWAARSITGFLATSCNRVSRVCRYPVALLIRALQRCISLVGFVLVVCFGIMALHDQTEKLIPYYVMQVAERTSAPIFNLFHVRSKWDWIYGGGMRNRFLVVRAKTPNSSRLVNMSSVNYRGVFYNYFMNYANSILRNKEDARRLFLYARFLCSDGFEAAGLRQFDGQLSSLELFDVFDGANSLAKLSVDYQEELERSIDGSAPFFSFNCENWSASSGRSYDWQKAARNPQPGSALELPLLGWSQDYGVLRLDKAVEGAPISIRGRIFERGFGTHANSRIRLATKGLHRFRAYVGVDDEKGSSPYASVVVRIEGDGQELYRSPLLSAQSAATLVDISIEGISELALISEDAGSGLGSNKICDDHVSWAAPYVE